MIPRRPGQKFGGLLLLTPPWNMVDDVRPTEAESRNIRPPEEECDCLTVIVHVVLMSDSIAPRKLR